MDRLVKVVNRRMQALLLLASRREAHPAILEVAMQSVESAVASLREAVFSAQATEKEIS